MLKTILVQNLIVCLIVVLSSFQAQATNQKPIVGGTGYEKAIAPQLDAGAIIVDNDTLQPEKPIIVKIKFLKQPPLTGIKERVNRLILGIALDVPPEFDHYGYEIRRYMSAVGDMRVYSDTDFLIKQIVAVRKAKVIAEYWENHTSDEIKAMEQEIENGTNIPLTLKREFLENRSTVESFMLILNSWLDANERLLMFIFNNQGIYNIDYPQILITASQKRIDLFNLIAIKQSKLRLIQNYRLWEFMRY